MIAMGLALPYPRRTTACRRRSVTDMKRYAVVFAVSALVIAVVALSGTSSPTPITAAKALVYGAILAGPPVVVWWAIATSRQR